MKPIELALAAFFALGFLSGVAVAALWKDPKD